MKEKEDLHPDLESPGINDDTFCEYRYFTIEPTFHQLYGNIWHYFPLICAFFSGLKARTKPGRALDVQQAKVTATRTVRAKQQQQQKQCCSHINAIDVFLFHVVLCD